MNIVFFKKRGGRCHEDDWKKWNDLYKRREMLNLVDVDGDGLIDINEFIDMMKKGDKVNLEDKGQILSAFLSYNHRMSQLARNVLLAH